jgi:hypothetical protein
MTGDYEFDPLRILKIRKDSNEFASFHITYINEWAYSKIYLPASNGGLFATDIKNVYLKFNEKGQLVIDWKGVRKILKPVKESAKYATNRLLAITKDATSSVADVAQLFRALHNRGIILDSHIEWQPNATGYWLLHHNRPEDSVKIFELQTELFPTAANGFDSLGDGYMALSENKKATEAYKTVSRLDPGFTHPKNMLKKIGD